MTEQVIRHRGGQRDEDGKLTVGIDRPLMAFAVAPGGGSEQAERARDGETIDYIVYFTTTTDIVNSDELTVRGDRYTVIVNDWRLAGRGGMEVLCTRGQG